MQEIDKNTHTVQNRAMTKKEEQIAAAAIAVFSRYGVKRTTMNDIAQEAGVVRQTLYNVFANKDEVIHGTILYYSERQRLKTLQEWQGVTTLAEKLDILFKNHVSTPWKDIKKFPDAEDLGSGFNAASQHALDEAAVRIRGTLYDLFAPYRHALQGIGESPETFGDFVEGAMRGVKYGCHSVDELTQRLTTLKSVVLKFVGYKPEPVPSEFVTAR